MNAAETFLFETGLKSLALMAVVCALMLIRRKDSASTLHFLWFASLCGLLLLPLGPVLGPVWHAPPWAGQPLTRWVGTGPANSVPPPIKLSGARKPVRTVEIKTGPKMAVRQRATVNSKVIDWRSWLCLVWSVGVVIALSRLFWRQALLGKISRTSRVPEDMTAQNLLRLTQRELGFTRDVQLLESSEPLMPMTLGCWRPKVLLPSSFSSWQADRLKFVLRHELAHVQRSDCLTQGLGNLACALYWFNPLVWHAQRQMRLEQERACDDIVLGLDTQASDYAGHLLAVAEQFACASRLPALPMVRKSNLETRVTALLDFRRNRDRFNPAMASILGFVTMMM
ncbi:MAG TPA: M56 family metallopeptidase, partial [Verrucomicrobiae bacterium]